MTIFTTIKLILIIIGICSLIFGIIFKPFNVRTEHHKPMAHANNRIADVLESISSIKLCGKFLNYLSKNKNSFLNNFMIKILELSEAGISLQQLYFIKILCLLLVTLLLLIIKYYYIFIIFASFFIPDIFLIIRWLLRGSVYKKEIIKLEYIFELLARVDGVKTIDIINELSKSSKIFSKCMNEFVSIFQYNKQNAFDYLKSKNIKGLSKLANILEVYSLSDKELAIQILDREIMERDEQMIITAEESIDFIDLVAFLSIVPIVYELARLMLDPMLDIVYKAFEFI